MQRVRDHWICKVGDGTRLYKIRWLRRSKKAEDARSCQAKICLVIEATIQECREGPAVQ